MNRYCSSSEIIDIKQCFHAGTLSTLRSVLKPVSQYSFGHFLWEHSFGSALNLAQICFVKRGKFPDIEKCKKF